MVIAPERSVIPGPRRAGGRRLAALRIAPAALTLDGALLAEPDALSRSAGERPLGRSNLALLVVVGGDVAERCSERIRRGADRPAVGALLQPVRRG